MPWEVTFRNCDKSTIGTRDEVIQKISVAVPAFDWVEEPPMLERIKDIPDHPFHALIPTWPEETRARFSRSKTYGHFNGNGFSVQLYGFETDAIDAIYAEICGDGNPMPLVAALCIPNGWIAVDDTTQQQIDLSAKTAKGWKAFKRYCARIIQRIEASDKPKVD